MKRMIRQVSKDLRITKSEAELIVATLLEKPRFEIYLNNKLDSDTIKILKMKLLQLKKGMPIEYITKKVQFLNYLLHVYPGVFIPRLETEYFIELIKETISFCPGKILEIGTGSGAIAIALADVFPEARIVATDISQTAIACARENIARCGLIKRITLLRCDMYDGFSEKYDIIVSNPPYIPQSRLKSLPDSVKKFEPILAINGGEDGAQFIKRLISKGGDHLNSNGMMAIEIDEEEVKILQRFLKTKTAMPFVFKKDLFNRFRYLFIGVTGKKTACTDSP